MPAEEAYVEAELELPEGFLEDEALEALAELRPEDEDGLVLARRIFADGRTRAYAWGRSAAREDLAAAGEQLVAMSGQFEQRRLARAAYRLDVLDGFSGDDQRRRRRDAQLAWRELAAARRAHEEAARGAADAEERLAELRALAEDTEGFEPGAEDDLRTERERLRHVTELAEGAAAAAEALAPDEGDGATGLVARAERAIAPLESLAPELARAGEELRDSGLRLRETALDLRTFLGTLEAEPGRLEQIEAELERIADAKRRFRCSSYEELLARADEARTELARLEAGDDPAAAAAAALAHAERQVSELHDALHEARAAAVQPFAEAVAEELRGMGVGETFAADLSQREPGPTGTDEVAFLIQPNPGVAPAPLHETASGGELSRIALAIAAVAGGATMVFDEIDAGIGGQTAHAVGETPAPPGRAGAGRHDHPPAADREPRRPPLPRREGAGRPDRDPHPRALGRGAPRGARADARRQGVPLDGAMSFVEYTGPARLDRRTKRLTRRLSADDIAIIDHTDLDRVSAEELLESGVRVVVNVSDSQSGRFPNPGPLLLVRGGVCLIDAPGAELFESVDDGELLTVRGASLYRNGTRVAAGRIQSADELAARLAEQRGRVTEALEAFADNTMRYLREEGRLLSEGIDFPPLATRFRDRHALVVVRGPGHKRDLRIVRPYVRDFRPVLIGVDGGADALLEAGYQPDVIVGDMDSVGERALQSGAELLVHAYPDGPAPGAARLDELGLAVRGRARAGHVRGRRAPARLREGRRADRRRRHAPEPDRVPGARPLRDVVDLPDAAEGGGDPRRREGRLAARLAPGRAAAVPRVRARRADRSRRRRRRLAGAPGRVRAGRDPPA